MALRKGWHYQTPDGDGFLVHDNGRGMVRVHLKNGPFNGDERTFRAGDLKPTYDPEITVGMDVRLPDGKWGRVSEVFDGHGAFMKPYRVDVKFEPSRLCAAYELEKDTDIPVDPLDFEREEDIYSDAMTVIDEKLTEAKAEVERLEIVRRALLDGRKGWDNA